MSKQDGELYEKLKMVMTDNINDSTAIDFLANLNKPEYNRLIEIIADDQTIKAKPEVKDKILSFLKTIRDNIQ